MATVRWNRVLLLTASLACSPEPEAPPPPPVEVCPAACACDTTTTCDTDCGCDPECGQCLPLCAASCACDTSTACDAECACDPECRPCAPPPPPPPPPSMQGALGEACTSGGACSSGYCHEDTARQEKYCSMQCEGACPAGFRCEVLRTSFAACVRSVEPPPPPTGDITTGSRDGTFTYGPNGLNLGWDYPGREVREWDFYHGAAAEPPLYRSGLTQTSARVAAADLSDGTVFHWKVVGRTHAGSIQSETWSYTARRSPIQGPCPDLPSVELEGRTIATLEVEGRCWLSRDLTVGEDYQGALLDDGRVQRICASASCESAVYSWWEAHNQYAPRADDVAAAICPPGFHLPTRAEWDALLALGVGALRFSPFFLEFAGSVAPQTGDLELCPDPRNAALTVPCILMGSWRDTSAAHYWVAEAAANSATRLVITHQGSGQYSVSYGNPRPSFTAAVRCLRR